MRERKDSDLAPLEELLAQVHSASGYPRYFPEGPASFLQAPAEVGAWVAVCHGRMAGHVALHRADSPLGRRVAALAGLTPDRAAMVARLFVHPASQGVGVGRRLLDRAVGASHELGRTPVLDVVDDPEGAARFYDALGWRRCGTSPIGLGSRRLELIAFCGPPPHGPVR